MLCRICANPSEEEKMVQILSKEGNKLRLADKILQHLPIAVSISYQDNEYFMYQ